MLAKTPSLLGVGLDQTYPVAPSLPFVSEAGIMDLPAGWTVGDHGEFRHVSGLLVIASEEWVLDTPESEEGCVWLHVSLSHRSRLPDWVDLLRVKHAFIGPDRVAVMVLPPDEEYINDHPNVHHLWCNLDHRATPDFRRFHPGLGMTL
jgi:hypothetical protein